MELGQLAVRAVFTFAFLLLLVRLTGKRAVSEATAFEFVFALVLGDLVDNAIFASVPMVQFLVAGAALAMAAVATEVAAYFSTTVHRLVDGRPRLVLRDGRPCEAGTWHELLTPHEVERILRERGVDLADRHAVHRAWLETSGEASVFKHHRARPAQKCDRDRL